MAGRDDSSSDPKRMPSVDEPICEFLDFLIMTIYLCIVKVVYRIALDKINYP